MAKVMVDTYLAAHHGQMPEAAWIKRRDKWTYAVSERAWQSTLTEPEHAECVYVAECQSSGEVIGLGYGHISDRKLLLNAGEVGALYVREAFQGQGIGRGLVAAIATYLATQGCSALIICVLTVNTAARRFYEAIGGRIIGEAEFDEEGWLLPETIYGWDNIKTVSNMTSHH